MAFCLDLHHIMEVTLSIGLEGNVHLDCQTGGEGPLHVMLNLELGGFGASELQPAHTLADVSNRHCYLVILVGLDVYNNERYKLKHLPLKKISGGKTSIGSSVLPRWLVVVLFNTGSGYLCSIEYYLAADFFISKI